MQPGGFIVIVVEGYMRIPLFISLARRRNVEIFIHFLRENLVETYLHTRR